MDARIHAIPDDDQNSAARFTEAVEYLEKRINYENFQNLPYAELEGRLVRMRAMLVHLGSPDKKYLTVHVAGTKGKGSTCILLKNILQQAGLRVGFFSSPHLYSFTERFAVNGTPCPDAEFADIMLSLRDRIESWEGENPFTYFELTTLFAFEYFAREKVDVAIFEVGLGGRLDATNACSPNITIISNISFDHMEQLGGTLEEIAAEKAGIIKSGVPIIANPGNEIACSVIKNTAAVVNAPGLFFGEDFTITPSNGADFVKEFRYIPIGKKNPALVEIDTLSLKLLGVHQQQNASLAISAALLLRSHLDISENAIRNGLAKAFLPIRVETLRPGPDSPMFIVDGAHNQASVVAFVRALDSITARKRFLVFGTTLGKDIEGMLSELQPFFDKIILTQHSSSPRRFPPRGLLTIISSLPTAPLSLQNSFRFASVPGFGESPLDDEVALSFFERRWDELAEAGTTAADNEIEIEENCCVALEKCWAEAGKDDLVCVTGSMYLAGELRKYFSETIAPRIS